ncbi:helix-turn-helix domain-containing protein [Bacillus cereus]
MHKQMGYARFVFNPFLFLWNSEYKEEKGLTYDICSL